MITLIGILVGLLVFLLFTPIRIRRVDAAQRLAEMYSLDTTRALSELKPDSLEYKLLAGGVRLQPNTFRLLLAAAGLAAGAIAWPFLPGVPALVLGGIAAYLPTAWLDDRVKNRGREIDRILPVAVGRIAAGLLASSSIPEVLQRTGESLDMEGPNPLAPELILTAAELRSKERHQTFRNLAARSPSTSLANLAFPAGRLQRERRRQIHRGPAADLAAHPANPGGAQPLGGQGRGCFPLGAHHPPGAAGRLSGSGERSPDPGFVEFFPRPDRDRGRDRDDDRGLSGHAFDCFGGGMTLITLIGIAVTTLLIDLWVEFVPSVSANKAARTLAESDQPAAPCSSQLAGMALPAGPSHCPLGAGAGPEAGQSRSVFRPAQRKMEWLGCGPIHLPAGGRLPGRPDPGFAGLRQPGPQPDRRPGRLADPANAAGQYRAPGAPALPGPASRIHPARIRPDGGRGLPGRGPAAHIPDRKPGVDLDAKRDPAWPRAGWCSPSCSKKRAIQDCQT